MEGTMKITWHDIIPPDHKQEFCKYYPARGTDAFGNVFWMSANREICSCHTKDGRYGMGWTAEQALENAAESTRRS